MSFYAVAKGRNVGIYNTWDDCEAEIKGFPGARFKKFKSREEAMDFIEANSGIGSSFAPRSFERNNSLTSLGPSSSASFSTFQQSHSDGQLFATKSNRSGTVTITQKTKCFYSVAKGSHPGIYNTWNECEEAIKDFQYPKYRKFNSYEEAKKFFEENRSHSSTNRAMNKRSFLDDGEDTSKKFAFGDGNTPVVYTDGACSNNGRGNAAAGFGVYWGPDHPDNVSLPVSGAATNNRAEYEAVYHAMKQAREKGHQNLIICTDSKLLINSMTDWIVKWKENGWKKSDGEAVRNRDLLEAIDGIKTDINVHFEHVKGHAGIHGNEMADAFAREGAQKYLAQRRCS